MAKIAKWSPTPHLHSRSSTQQIMYEFSAVLGVISLIAISVYGYTFGGAYALKAIWMLLVSIISAILTETIFFACGRRFKDVYEWLTLIVKSYSLITAILLALCLPIGTPLMVVAIGSCVSVWLGKLVFGGVGYNPFNPALVGRALVTISFGGLLTTTLTQVDAVTSVTPLVHLAQNQYIGTYEQLTAPYGGLVGLLMGTYGGAIGESISFAIIIAMIYLVVRRIIDWRIPAFYLGTVFFMTWIVGAMNGVAGMWYPLFHLLSGGLLFGAAFMATDLVTSPVSRKGKVFFGMALGILTVIIRLLGNYPEGVFFSILIMNLFKPVIDRGFMGRMNLPLKRGEICFWLVSFLIVIGIAVLIGIMI